MAFTEKRLAGPIQVSAGATSTLYTCPTSPSTSTMLKQIVICNIGSVVANFNINLVPQGDSVSLVNRIFSNTAIDANETIILDLSQIMVSGDFISFTAANANVSVTISGVENQGAMVLSGLADNAVTSAKIADSAVLEAKLASNSVTSAKIVDGTIVNADINASANIDATKISGTAVVASTIDAKGDLLAGTADNALTRLAVGSSNRYLRANSSTTTGLEWSTNQVGLEFISSQTFVNSNNMLMPTVFSSTYTNYVVMINITSSNTNPTTVFMRLANGSTVETGAIYLYGGFISYMGSGILTAINNSGASTDWGLTIEDSTFGYGGLPIRVDVMQPMLSYRTSIYSSGFQPVNPLPYYRHLGGTTTNTSTYNGFTIIGNNSGVLLNGTITVYGYRIS